MSDRATTSVAVDLGQRSYEVVIGSGASAVLGRLVAGRFPDAARAALVTDATVASQPWFASVDPGVPFDVFSVPPGERSKTPAQVEDLCRGFAGARLARRDVVVAVGGGVVTDLGGFAAAVYHRGLGYCSVSTTLLGQVDAAIGGKTGVDVPEGKNLMGAFWQPSGVVCDTDHLDTLPAREWASGRGEMAKYVLLATAVGTLGRRVEGLGRAVAPFGSGEGAGGTAHLEDELLDAPVAEQVARCVEVKARLVAADERELDPSSGRVVLNYGHTLAHALEAAALASGADLAHGEAVAIGLVYAALLARRLGRIGDDRVAQHRRVVERFGLSGRFVGPDPKELVAYMARDKKAGHDLSFVLDGPRGIELVRGVEEADVLGALEELPCI